MNALVNDALRGTFLINSNLVLYIIIVKGATAMCKVHYFYYYVVVLFFYIFNKQYLIN